MLKLRLKVDPFIQHFIRKTCRFFNSIVAGTSSCINQLIQRYASCPSWLFPVHHLKQNVDSFSSAKFWNRIFKVLPAIFVSLILMLTASASHPYLPKNISSFYNLPRCTVLFQSNQFFNLSRPNQQYSYFFGSFPALAFLVPPGYLQWLLGTASTLRD